MIKAKVIGYCLLIRLSVIVLTSLAANLASAVTVTVSPTVVGKTPETVGFNSGHFMPGSNTAAWYKYTGVNGARVWVAPTIIEETPGSSVLDDDNGIWGDGVTTQQQFVDRRTALRASPLNTSYINWPFFNNNYENNYDTSPTGNHIRFNYAFGQLKAQGVDPLVNIMRTNNAFAFDPAGSVEGWKDRWEHWQHYYAQAFYLARNFNVHRFQVYNEPNLDDVPVPEYLERLRIASDAIQSAVADVNSLFGKSLDAQVQGPVTNAPRAQGVVSVYNNWGLPVMQNMHTNYLGQNDPNFRVIDTFAYQQYSIPGETFGSEYATIKNLVNSAAGGQPMRFALSEFNVWSAVGFENRPAENMDNPLDFAGLGSILSNLTKNQIDELYLFKFSQTADNSVSGVKKNGASYVDNGNAPYNIGGITKGAEVMRLFAKGFQGARDLMANPAASGSGATDLQVLTSHNGAAGKYSIMSTNTATSSRTLDLNLSAWNLEPGARILIEEVSSTRHGEVSHIITVPASGILPQITQPAQSVLYFSVPENAPAYVTTLGATDDAVVKSGANVDTNFGAAVSLVAKNDALEPSARNVTFIKFNSGSIAASAVEQAVLQVFGENLGSAVEVTTHVYGLTDDAWNESTITWRHAPNLADSFGMEVDDISENFVEGIGTSTQIVGHFTGIATSRTMAIDVTDFVRSHPDQELTFMVAREVRIDGEDVDDALTALQMASKERGTNPGPRLLLSLSDFALPGDYDHNGMVDSGDYEVWRANVGSSSPIADGNRNGIVDSADYVVWRQNIGKSLPGTLSGSSFATIAIPEPTATYLAILAISMFSCRRAGRRCRR